MTAHVFLTGSTGYVGSRLIPRLLARGHRVTALVRAGSRDRLPAGCEPVVGDALDRATFQERIPPADTFVQLVGVPRPNPRKATQFRAVDLVSVRESAAAAAASGVRHFVYVSVAQPAPVMKAYVEVRAEGESIVRATGMDATFVRPWYVVGPGHRWAYALSPMYWLLERIPATRATALRLGLVTLEQMLRTLLRCIEDPARGVKIVEVPQIRGA